VESTDPVLDWFETDPLPPTRLTRSAAVAIIDGCVALQSLPGGPGEAIERAPDERGLAVAPGGDEEEAVVLLVAAGEGMGGDDLALDEGGGDRHYREWRNDCPDFA
jgi:hypothetical protein